MKSLIFDAGPVISLTTNNLLWLLKDLNNHFDGTFYIPLHVKEELIDVPLMTKKFKFEALQVMQHIRQGVLNVYQDPKLEGRSLELLSLANKCFRGKSNWIKIVHLGEMQAVASALMLKSGAVVIDEINMRMLLEDPLRLTKIMRRRLKINIKVDKDNLKAFRRIVSGVKTIRSVELVIRAFELGFLKDYLPNQSVDVENPKKTLLSSLLWGLKIRGCGLSRRELDELIRIET